MSFIEENSLQSTGLESSPPTPPEGTRGLFPKEDGWYDIDSDGNEHKIANVEDIKKGEGGVSPTISFTPTNNGYTMKVVDVEGEKSIDIFNGEKGDKGDAGLQGNKGDTGENGKDGFSPTVELTEEGNGNRLTISDIEGKKSVFISNGKDGLDGNDGENGISVTHKWDGTKLSITSASGTSSVDLKGEQGIQGVPGEKGDKGSDGYTPKKGEDYWTDEEISELLSPYITRAEMDGLESLELLCDETIKEEVSTISVTADTEGNAFELDELYACVKIPNPNSIKPYIYFAENTSCYMTYGDLGTNNSTLLISWKRGELYAKIEQYRYYNTFNTSKILAVTDDIVVNQFRMQLWTEGSIFPIGTEVKVWGRKVQ